MAIDKEINNPHFGYEFERPEFIKPSTFSKIVRVGLFGSFIVGGFSRAGQTLKWITDEDEIISNTRTQDATIKLISHMLMRFCPGGFSEVTFGISGKFNDDRRAEDLCSIPDLVGGAVAETLTELGHLLPRAPGEPSAFPSKGSFKSRLILSWLRSLDELLMPIILVLRKDDVTGMNVSFLNIERNPAVQRGIYIRTPAVTGWPLSMRSWRREFIGRLLNR